MKTLPETFDGRGDQHGYRFQQLKREGDVAIFKKWKPELKHPKIYFEVVLIRKVGETRFPNGVTVPPHEKMPSSSEWGTLSSSPATLAKAEEKFYEYLLA